jgi:hypothetical protein
MASASASRRGSAVAHRTDLPGAQERRPRSAGRAGAGCRACVQAGCAGAGGGVAHYPARRCARRRATSGQRRRRCRPDRSRSGDRPHARRQNRATAEPASAAQSRLARVNRRPPRRLELLLQAARTEDHADRLGPPRCHGRGLWHRATSIIPPYPAASCVNPVALGGRAYI